MPYATPTAAELKARYPEFATVSDALVNFAIGDAGRFVDTGWFEDDYQRAIMALAAHILAMDGALNISDTWTVSSGAIVSDKLGDASVTYASGSGSGSLGGNSEYATTSYGRTFLRLQRVNVPAIVIL